MWSPRLPHLCKAVAHPLQPPTPAPGPTLGNMEAETEGPTQNCWARSPWTCLVTADPGRRTRKVQRGRGLRDAPAAQRRPGPPQLWLRCQGSRGAAGRRAGLEVSRGSLPPVWCPKYQWPFCGFTLRPMPACLVGNSQTPLIASTPRSSLTPESSLCGKGMSKARGWCDPKLEGSGKTAGKAGPARLPLSPALSGQLLGRAS